MPVPSPRNKILPARGNYADLAANIISLLDGEICYAIDQDQYYQNEEGVLISVGATKAQGILADSSVQPLDNISVLTNDANYITAEEAPVQPSDLSTKADLVGGKVPNSQLPSIAITQYLGEVADEAGMLALSGEKGDWAIRTDTSSTWVITGDDAAQSGSWTELAHPGDLVTSVNGYQGAVVLGAADVGAIPATDAPNFAPSTLDLQSVTSNGNTTTTGASFDGVTKTNTAFQVNTYSDAALSDVGSFLTGGILALKNADTSSDSLEVLRVLRGTTDVITFQADGSASFANTVQSPNFFGNATGTAQVWYGGATGTSVITADGNGTFSGAVVSVGDPTNGGANGTRLGSTVQCGNGGGPVWLGYTTGTTTATSTIDNTGTATFEGVVTGKGLTLKPSNGSGGLYVMETDGTTTAATVLADGSASFEGAVQVNGSVAGDSCFITRLNGGAASSLITADGTAKFGATSVGHTDLNKDSVSIYPETTAAGTTPIISSYDSNWSSPTFQVTASGSANFAGDITSGDFSTATATGALVSGTGAVMVRQQSGNGVIWNGLLGSTATSQILANGNASFAKRVLVGAEYTGTGISNTQGAGVYDGYFSCTNAAGSYSILEGYLKGTSTPTVLITADGSASFAGNVTANGGVTVDGGTSLSTGLYYRDDSEANGLALYSGGSAQNNRKVFIKTDGSASFDGAVQAGSSTTDVGSNIFYANRTGGALFAKNYGSGASFKAEGGSTQPAIQVDNSDGTTGTAAINGDGSASFAGPVTVKQDLTNSFGTEAFVVSNATQDQVIRLNNNGSASFKDGSSIFAGINGGSAVFYGGDSSTTSQSNAKFRLNTSGSASFAGGIEVAASSGPLLDLQRLDYEQGVTSNASAYSVFDIQDKNGLRTARYTADGSIFLGNDPLSSDSGPGNSLISFNGGDGSAIFKGTVTATVVPPSDARFKENIEPAKPQLADVVALGGILKNYDWNEDAPVNDELRTVRQLGLVAQEAEVICPGIVKDLGSEEDRYKGISQDALVMKLLGAVAELTSRVEELESR